MPSSGARSGTKPKRPAPAGTGRTGGTPLACGHEVLELEEVAKYPGGARLYRCGVCFTLQKKATKR